ncbi:MAG: hypothetical protein WC789_03805 [Lentisphaeria bacterium]|jgi:hypothetical protein
MSMFGKFVKHKSGNKVQPVVPAERKLPYPTRPLAVQGGTVEEYIIPDDKKADVLAQLCFFRPIPLLDEEFFDVHEGKNFRVRDFRVTWEGGQNFLVSPYYPSSGGTIIDWMPADSAAQE